MDGVRRLAHCVAVFTIDGEGGLAMARRARNSGAYARSDDGYIWVWDPVMRQTRLVYIDQRFFRQYGCFLVDKED